MNRGGKAALLISCLGLAGCVTETKQVELRKIDPSAALSRGGDSVAVARGQLALGNVGLALEGFRKAQRENPNEPAALAGIGDCYVAMGRFDLAQTNYEQALALVPHDRKLLLALAAVFEREGLPLRALAARADADRALHAAPVSAPAVASAAVEQADRQALQALAARGSITVELPPAKPADHVDATSIAQPLPQIAENIPASSSVTVQLPPAVPASPTPAPRKTDPSQAVALATAPRLERLSPGEVALVTTSKPLWQAQSATRMASVGSVRWVALAQNGPRPNVQVVNAAKAQGIAASARSVLLDRGWRRIAIGTAAAAQDKSVVLYPRNREKLGRSLAAQFGVSARMVERDILVLVLGRDAVDRIVGQRKS